MQTPHLKAAPAILMLAALLAACDTSSQPDAAKSLTPLGTYVVPANVPADVMAAAEKEATERSCSGPPMLLPAGTTVRIVEEEGARVIYARFPEGSGKTGVGADRAEDAARAGRVDKGDGKPGGAGGLRVVRLAEEVKFTCYCSEGEQSQRNGCTPAYHSGSGHIYCDNSGNCPQCTMEVHQ